MFKFKPTVYMKSSFPKRYSTIFIILQLKKQFLHFKIFFLNTL